MSSLLTEIPSASKRVVPALNNGDHLNAAEFLRRYEAMPEGIKAELINGIVYMSPPVRYRSHGKPHLILSNWLGHYIAKTAGLTVFGDNSTVRLAEGSTPQPDLCLLIPAHLGGKASVDELDYISGPPALACEIAGSSVSFDLHEKKEMYASSGISEYLVWRTEDSAIDWFSLEGEHYITLQPAADGTLRSTIFPGLWLHPESLLNADLAAVFKLLDQSTSIPEHAAFVQRLSAP